MITSKDIDLIERVYYYFLHGEEESWTKVDDYMTYLEYLDLDQLVREVEVMLKEHQKGNPHCSKIHPKGQKCFVSSIVNAVEIIKNEYLAGEPVHLEDDYILRKYLSFSQAKIILY